MLQSHLLASSTALCIPRLRQPNSKYARPASLETQGERAKAATNKTGQGKAVIFALRFSSFDSWFASLPQVTCRHSDQGRLHTNKKHSTSHSRCAILSSGRTATTSTCSQSADHTAPYSSGRKYDSCSQQDLHKCSDCHCQTQTSRPYWRAISDTSCDTCPTVILAIPEQV